MEIWPATVKLAPPPNFGTLDARAGGDGLDVAEVGMQHELEIFIGVGLFEVGQELG